MKAQDTRADRRKAEVWFDFDGTLADSAPGVMQSLQEAFLQNGMEIPSLAANTVVGPPLAEVIGSLAPSASPETRERIVQAFRLSYDARGYASTAPFVGFPGVFHELIARGLKLRILTNKRQCPLERIVTRLGWEDFFVGLHGIEEGGPHGMHASKPDRAARLALSVRVAAVSIVGDGLDDLRAAERIGAQFILAGWGYGTTRVLAERPQVTVLQKPSELLAQLQSAW
jgi:phosphoglycolate phosphatase